MNNMWKSQGYEGDYSVSENWQTIIINDEIVAIDYITRPGSKWVYGSTNRFIERYKENAK